MAQPCPPRERGLSHWATLASLASHYCLLKYTDEALFFAFLSFQSETPAFREEEALLPDHPLLTECWLVLLAAEVLTGTALLVPA